MLGKDGQVPGDVVRLRGHVEGLRGRVDGAIKAWEEEYGASEEGETTTTKAAASKKGTEEEDEEEKGTVATIRPLAKIPVGSGLFARTLLEAVRTMRRAWVGGLPPDLNEELSDLEALLVPLLETIRPHE